jgi:hypothetical protein
MHEFDKHIYRFLNETANTINKRENRTSQKNRVENKTYASYQAKKTWELKKIKNLTSKLAIPIHEYSDQDKQELKTLTKTKRRYKSLVLSTKSTLNHIKPVRFVYTRYADDWIILTNTTKQVAVEIKDHIQIWLKENLDLNLSLEKTKITDIEKEYCHFLGFRFKNNQRKAPVRKVKMTIKEKNKPPREIIVKRRPNWGLYCSIDHNRIIQRFINKKLMNKKKSPIHSNLHIPLKPHEIIYRFKMMIEGLFNYYYKNITFKSLLHKYHYYLLYSCYKTLAAREKTSIRKIILKYGVNPKVSYEEINKNEDENEVKEKRFQQILSYGKSLKEIQNRYVKGKAKPKPDTDFLTVKVNLRTAYKFIKYCSICGASPTNNNPIESC